ncbi:MAG TPA: Crp/Fnr family transcriptional regulator [Pyrinomonadaceae bacterium]|jgi:CRP-like cAMP-binding protein
MSELLRYSTNNHILNALPYKDYQRLHPHLENVNLVLGQIIYRPNESIRYVYFPNNSMNSIIATTLDGQCAEIGVIGREGIVGVDVFMGVESSSHKNIIQLANGALRISTEEIRKEFNRAGALQKMVLRYMHSFMMQISQTALCNRLHLVDQRLSRWLLMCHDRSPSNELTLTQEFLSIMLGVNRPIVTGAARVLQGRKYIRYSRGNITILDREGLEDFACNCYQVVRDGNVILPQII